MQHAVAIEPVIGSQRGELGIGAIADVEAVQLGREFADDLEIVGRDLFPDRGKIAFQEGAFHGAGFWIGVGQEAAGTEAKPGSPRRGGMQKVSS